MVKRNKKVIITVQAHFNKFKRDSTLKTGKLAEFKDNIL